MSMAAGARVPARLEHAFVAAAESELARVKDLGAPPDSFSVVLRERLLAAIRGYDFDDPPYRLFVRECFGPRELTALAQLKSQGYENADAAPWFPLHPSAARSVPFVAIPDIPRSSLSPWRDARTLHSWASPVPTYTPPAFPDSSTPPRLDVAVLASPGKSPSARMVRSAIHVKNRTCANCGKVAAKGSTFRKCAQCTVRTYCDVACQKMGWAVHRNECKEFVNMIEETQHDPSDPQAAVRTIPKGFAASFFSVLSRRGIRFFGPPQDTPPLHTYYTPRR
jgi:hypothetical protein